MIRPPSPRNKLTPRVAVIGGGVAGLSAAVNLASRGVAVTIFEKNAALGGKLNRWQKGGFTFDTGPHVLTMLFAIQELFQTAGERFEDHVDLIRLPTICRYHFPDGDYFDAAADPRQTGEQIGKIFPGGKDEFFAYLSHSQDVYEKTVDTFLRQDPSEAMKRAGAFSALASLKGFLDLNPFESLDRRIQRTFTDERLRQIFRLYALYSGSHPKRCSSIFSVVAHVQWNIGTFYLKGGLYSLVEAIKELMSKLNVQVALNSEVTEITTEGKNCRAIKVMSNGTETEHLVDGLICNQDVLTAHRLLPNLSPPTDVEPSTSAFLILAGIRGSYPTLSHHNSFLTGDEWREYAEIFDNHEPPTDPTIGVSNQSFSDSSRAPDGMTNLFIMANVPAMADQRTWTPERTADYRSVILRKLERMGLPDLESRIIVEDMWTPNDFSIRYNSYRGSLYGLSSNGWKQAFLRPPQRAKGLRGLYYAGGTTHPGGGVPLCILSGKIAAEQLIADL